MGASNSNPLTQDNVITPLALSPVMGPQMAAVAGLGALGNYQQQGYNKKLRRVYEPQAESAALQQRQMSIASGTTGGAGFAAETQAYNEIMRMMAQAQQAYQQQTQAQQMQALQSINRIGGYFAGGGVGGGY